MAQQARPNVIGQMLDCRAQLIACSTVVVKTFSSSRASIHGWAGVAVWVGCVIVSLGFDDCWHCHKFVRIPHTAAGSPGTSLEVGSNEQHLSPSKRQELNRKFSPTSSENII